MKSPAFQFYPSDWLEKKVLRMSDAAQGIYIRLLCYMWNDSPDQCSIEKDVKIISKLLGISIQKWKKTLNEIMWKGDPIFIETDTHYISKRLAKEREKQLDKSEKAKSAINKRWHTDVIPESYGRNTDVIPALYTSSSTSSSIKETIPKGIEKKRAPSYGEDDFHDFTGNAPVESVPVKPISPDGKEPHGDFVRLTEKEFEALQLEYNADRVKQTIFDLNLHIGSTGKYYQSHYYTIKTWIERDMRKVSTLPPKKNQPKEVPPSPPKPDCEPYRKKLLAANKQANARFREKVIEPIHDEIGEHSWRQFIEPLVVTGYDTDSITVWCNPENEVWIRDHYLAQIAERAEKEIILTSKIDDDAQEHGKNQLSHH